jgi:hypothetical protein
MTPSASDMDQSLRVSNELITGECGNFRRMMVSSALNRGQPQWPQDWSEVSRDSAGHSAMAAVMAFPSLDSDGIETVPSGTTPKLDQYLKCHAWE